MEGRQLRRSTIRLAVVSAIAIGIAWQCAPPLHSAPEGIESGSDRNANSKPAQPSNTKLILKPEWKQYFDRYKLDGTFVLHDLQRNTRYVYNPERARRPFLPASTFKILHSMIALDTKVVRSENEVIRWDGKKTIWPRWNQDHNMRTAFRYSVVWFYQETARRIGHDRMQSYVDRVGYGNQDLSGPVDWFWLSGKLRINANDQVDLLLRLHREELPFSKSAMDKTKRIMLILRKGNVTLRGKTGWIAGKPPQLGWWVGWVERVVKVAPKNIKTKAAGKPRHTRRATARRFYFFALNMDMRDREDLPARQAIAYRILKERRVLD